MVTLKINGKSHTVDASPDMPLLWALRDLLGMNGTKFGCGVALCGACTVHLDGMPRRACVTPVSAAVGHAITTIEAIGGTPAGKKVQQAWLDLEVVQCGYCQSGQIMCQVERGQGRYTSMPMLLAEELEVGLDQVQLEHAPPDDKLYANPLLGDQETGASTSVRMFYEPLRRAGATARTMLVTAAAQTWKVDPASCQAARGVVTHTATGRKLTYAALADKAASLPVPEKVTLKDPEHFKLIGTPAKRLDTPAKVKGMTVFGMDVRLPGMKIATVAASPVVGGKVVSVDESKAKAIKGVRQIVRLDDAVAVVADNMWAAKQGLNALVIRWDDGPNATVSTADVVKGLAAASQTPGAVVRNEGDAPAVIASAPRKIELQHD